MANKEENLEESMLEYSEKYLEDIEYLQASTLKELEKKVRSRIEDDGAEINSNPFLDQTVTPAQWTQVVLYYTQKEEEEG